MRCDAWSSPATKNVLPGLAASHAVIADHNPDAVNTGFAAGRDMAATSAATHEGGAPWLAAWAKQINTTRAEKEEKQRSMLLQERGAVLPRNKRVVGPQVFFKKSASCGGPWGRG